MRRYLLLLLSVHLLGTAATASAETITLEQAVALATGKTTRSTLIRGNEQVASRKYDAQRINFYLPTISINGALPSYQVDQSYRFFGASPQKRLYRTRELGLNSFIRLQQNLLTGGALSITANLTGSNSRYPNTALGASPNDFLSERSQQGYFEFKIDQPILTPSPARNDLADAKDDLETARLTRGEEEAALAHEVTDAYVSLVQAKVGRELAATRLETARAQAEVDSSKWTDGVISEEDWLTSASARLDAELADREAETEMVSQERRLALLLDRAPAGRAAAGAADTTGLGGKGGIETVEPEPGAFTAADRDAALTGWDQSIAVRKAARASERSRRAASFAAAGHGLTGDLQAGYNAGRGKVWPEGQPVDNINTDGWNLSFNFSYPLWDGGAATASEQAARIQTEQARLALEKARQDARAEITRLADEISVSRRRLELLRKQIDLATERRSIAEERYADGRISTIDYLKSKSDVLDARGRYLTELKTCLLNEADLRGKFVRQTGTSS